MARIICFVLFCLLFILGSGTALDFCIKDYQTCVPTDGLKGNCCSGYCQSNDGIMGSCGYSRYYAESDYHY
ncbi:unnamed protein product [Orchesella dallaii]|uniref:Uncharacterized protein n=1 Tax=Orchesella dallaii TaxID=48710 RepID=A0ABP1QM33_9HEXA